MTGEYWAELENNHHYIIVDSEHDRTYYCPSEEVSNTLSHIMNNKNKKIRELNKKLHDIKHSVVFEIKRKLEHKYEHVAFVTNEELALDFCEKHKDCSYHEIHITKYRNELEARRVGVPCCESCEKTEARFKTDGTVHLFCKEYHGFVDKTECCEKWDRDL